VLRCAKLVVFTCVKPFVLQNPSSAFYKTLHLIVPQDLKQVSARLGTEMYPKLSASKASTLEACVPRSSRQGALTSKPAVCYILLAYKEPHECVFKHEFFVFSEA